MSQKIQKTISFSANTSWYLYNFRASTLTAFIEAGYKIICICPEDHATAKLIAMGCTWIPLKMNNKGTNPFQEISLLCRLFFIYKKLRPTAAFHFTIKNNIYGTFAASLLGIKSINNITGLGTIFVNNSPLKIPIKFLYKITQRKAFKVFCQNQEDFTYIQENHLVLKKKLILLPGSGVNLTKFQPTPRITMNEREFIFLYAGRMIGDKGLIELISAFQSMSQHKNKSSLWLSGFVDSNNHSSIPLSTILAWNDLPNIYWLGSSDEMNILFGRVDCVVLPSYREGMPKSLLEAGAMGLPVITTNVPGCRNLITDGVNGLICEPFSSNSLKLALEKMLELSPKRRFLMGQEGRSLVEKKYDENIVINHAIDAVKEIEIGE